jgi:hypothetical protein
MDRKERRSGPVSRSISWCIGGRVEEKRSHPSGSRMLSQHEWEGKTEDRAGLGEEGAWMLGLDRSHLRGSCKTLVAI